jgi:hypothetical protein
MKRGIPGYRIVAGMDEAAGVLIRADVRRLPPWTWTNRPFHRAGRGTPGWRVVATLRFLDALFRRTQVVAPMVGSAPIPGLHHADFTVARLVHHLVGLRVRA